MGCRVNGTFETSSNKSLILAIALTLLAIVQLMPGNFQLRTAARAAEAKSGLHEIQLAVEKYNRDNGCYPSWLIGGAARCAATVDTTTLDATFQDIRDCAQPAAVSDPLLRAGYLAAYPANPFVTAGIGIHQVQAHLPTAMASNDPLRSATESGALHGTRFGPTCRTMGNVMGDPRQREWTWVDPANDYYHPALTYADVDYHQWDMWLNSPPLPFLYGQFFYKSNWEIDPSPVEELGIPHDTPSQARPATMYLLGAYGGLSDRGQDVIGDEPMITLDLGAQGSMKVWPWTRSAASMGLSKPPGSPYGAASAGSGRQFTYGNPNGIDDAVELLLTSK